MTNTKHPITPSPELVKQWREAPEFSALSPCVMVTVTNTKLQDIATQAARWGSDQALEACCEWLKAKHWIEPEFADELRAARRPKPRTLKQRALKGLDVMIANGHLDGELAAAIREVLEASHD